jgi:hypothetical protein
MGRRSRRAAKTAVVSARRAARSELNVVSAPTLGAAGRNAGRRERGATKRAMRLTVAISEEEAVELRARASTLGVSVSRLMVETTLENVRLATAPKTAAARVDEAAARWQDGAASFKRVALSFAVADGRTDDLVRLMDDAIEADLRDSAGNRPPWILSVLPDEQLAIRAGERPARAWDWLAHRIARLRIERDVHDPRDHGLREDADRATWRGIEQLAHAIAVPDRLNSRIRLPGERANPAGAESDTTSDETGVEDDDGQFALGL